MHKGTAERTIDSKTIPVNNTGKNRSVFKLLISAIMTKTGKSDSKINEILYNLVRSRNLANMIELTTPKDAVNTPKVASCSTVIPNGDIIKLIKPAKA
jgi:hypothetical protein